MYGYIHMLYIIYVYKYTHICVYMYIHKSTYIYVDLFNDSCSVVTWGWKGLEERQEREFIKGHDGE